MTRKPSRQTAAVLRVFLINPDVWRYGYDLGKELQMASGTLYPILMRLHDRGHLETRWVKSETEGRPARHMYRLTSSGLGYAQFATPVGTALRPAEGFS